MLAVAAGLIVIASFVVGHRAGVRDGRSSGFSAGRRAGFSEGRSSLSALRPYPSLDASGGTQGRVDICLQTPALVKPGHSLNGQTDLTIEGTVMRFGDARSVPSLPGHVLFCEMEPEWYIDVADKQMVQWRLLYAVSGIAMEEPSLTIGTRVTIRLRAHWGFGKAAGVVVSDDAGPVLIAEQGFFGHGLEPEDYLPFTVHVGDAIGVEHDGCGDAVMHAVEVRGDSVVRVMPGQSGTVALRGRSYWFWNAASYNWINTSCTDMLDRMAWFLWRS
jgi:hypothetical protein